MTKFKTATAIIALVAAPAFAQDLTGDADVTGDLDVNDDAALSLDADLGAELDGGPETGLAEINPALDAETDVEGEIETEMAETGAAAALSADGEAMATEHAGDMTAEGTAGFDMEVAASEITGAPIYDAEDNRIGEIDDVILADDGSIDGAVVGVGGFLGIGEKDVLVSYQELDIRTDEDGADVRVYIAMSKEQLEAMPNFEG